MHIVGQHIAGQDYLCFGGWRRVEIIDGVRCVIDDFHINRTRGTAAVGVGGHYRETLTQGRAIAGGMRFVVEQGVGHHASAGVVTGDGQGIAFRSGRRLRETHRAAAAHHGNAANGQGLQAIRRGYREAAALSQGRAVRVATIAEVFLIDGQLAPFDIETVEGYRIVEVADIEHQVGGRAIAIGILERVGKGLDAVTTPLQVDEVRIAGVQRVGVGTVGRQHQGAVFAGDGLRGNRAAGDAVGALGVVGQDVAGQGQLVLSGGDRITVRICHRRIVDYFHINRARGTAAIGVGGDYRETLAQGRAVARGMRFVVEQRVGVGHHASAGVVPGDGQGIAFRGGRRLRETHRAAAAHHGNAANGQGLQAIRRGYREAAALSQGRAVRVATIAEVFLIDGQLAPFDIETVEGYRIVEVADIEHQVGGRTIAIGILERVGEGLDAVTTTLEVDEVRIAGVQRVSVGTVGRQHQGAVFTGDGLRGDRTAGNAVGALHIIAQHIAGQRQLRFRGRRRVEIVDGVRRVIDDVHIDRTRGAAAIGVGGHHCEALAEAGAITRAMRFAVEQGVDIRHHTGTGVVAGNGQGVAFRGDCRLREADRAAAGHHSNAAHGQGLQTIRCLHREATTLGQRRIIGAAAVTEVLLINGQLTAFEIEAIERDWIIQVADIDLQRRRAAVAVGVFEGVGEQFDTAAATVQVDEVRISSIQRIGVGTVSRQHQGAVGTRDGLRGDGSTGDTVSALAVVDQNVAGQGQLSLGGRRGIEIVDGVRRVIDDVHINRTRGFAAIAVGDHHREALAQAGAITRVMRIGTGQGVAVADHTGRSIVAGNGQNITKPGGDGLANTGHHTGSDDVNATDIQVEHPILGDHGKAASLGQGRWVTGRALRQIGFIQGQLAPLYPQPFETDRVVHHRWQWRHSIVVVDLTEIRFAQLGKAVEACSRETDNRINPTGHFVKQHKRVTTTQRPRRTATARTSRRRIGVLARVGTGSDGLLEFFHIGQLRLTRGLSFGRIDMRRLAGKQLRRECQAAVTAQG